MPKIIKNGLEYSGVPVEVVTAWAPTSDPVQVKEPLMGNTDISEIGDGSITGAISELNAGLTQIKSVTITFDAITAYGLDTKTVDVSSNPATFGQIVGWQLSNTTFLVPIQLYFSGTNKITCRVTNFTNNSIGAGAPLRVFYV